MSGNGNPILITGVAGFIGANLTKKLIENNQFVVGIDNLNQFQEGDIKKNRLDMLHDINKKKNGSFIFHLISLENAKEINSLFEKYKPKIVINLAAQAGVRYSIKNPALYVQSNLVGFSNILESCRNYEVEHFLYASSSSVYGGNTKLPYKESDNVNHPVSLYAATKKSNEMVAHSYSHLYNIPTTGMRFFTVYGPWGRTDMAPIIFSKAIVSGQKIKLFNYGKMRRDFTYIDDVVCAIIRCIKKIPKKNSSFDCNKPNPSISFAPFKVLNIGNSKSVELFYFIKILEKYLGKKANISLEPIQMGDVVETCADIKELKDWIDFEPQITIEDGLNKFTDWFKNFYLKNI